MIATRLFFIFWLLSFSTLYAQSILDNKELVTNEGLFHFYYLEEEDKIYLEVTDIENNFLYVSSLSEGIGSNDLLLDRGQIGGTRVVKFKKAGNKLLLVQPNLKYRAITANNLEKKSVKEAFAKSVLFGFPIIEDTKRGFLIDLTPFLLQDTHGVTKILKQKKQGTYKVDNSRSALNIERTKGFPENVDFDVLITLKGNPEKREIRSVTPNAQFVTVYQHHSFVKLPDDDFKTRKYHPNSGAISTSYMNYSAPIGQPLEVSFCRKHRLEKKNPDLEVSEAIEPIIYYLDNGTPEPVRSALLEGASWWNDAFEGIGFKNAFQVKMLPDNIDPLDVRYNVIQWVHRSTRGWSYGGGVVDPRTGEIIKGHVSLGSLRIRQDYLIAKALSKNPFSSGSNGHRKMLEFALARIRQLSAHEVGHTLGFAHNFAASMNDRASVMDYPHPAVAINNNEIDISNAYAVGIGEWDKITVAYSYSIFDQDEEKALLEIVQTAMESGYRYVSDRDARPLGSANPYGHLWDNGSNSIDGLDDVIRVRRKAIDQFGINNIQDGEPFSQLEDLFVLIYFYHRYQTEATIKSIGGIRYGYSLKGVVNRPTEPLSAQEQRKALDMVLRTIDATFLSIPKEKLELFPARSMGNRGRESFNTLTGSVFDPLSAVATACNESLKILLHQERINRLVHQQAIDQNQLGLDELIGKLIDRSLMKSFEERYLSEIQASINEVVLTRLMMASQNEATYPQVRAIVQDKLSQHLKYLNNVKKKTVYQKRTIQTIEQFFSNPQRLPSDRLPTIPDGSPIGTTSCSQG